MGIGASPYGVSDWQAQMRSPSLSGRGRGDLGRSPSHQRFWDLGAIGSEWNSFLNSVNIIFNFSCHTGKHQRRSVALPCYWGSGAEPQPPMLLGALGCKWNPFLNSLNIISNSACQTGKGRKRSPSLLGGSGAEPHFWEALTSFSTRSLRVCSLRPS